MSEFLYATSLASALAEYLLPCITSALTALVAWQGFRRVREHALREATLAFGVVAAIQAVLLGLSMWAAIPGSLLCALDCVSAAVMGWVFLGKLRRVFLLAALSSSGILGAFTLSLWQLSRAESAWSITIWWLNSAVLFGIATVALWVKRRERPLLLPAAFALLTLGSLLGAVGLTPGLLVLRLIAFPLFPVALMKLTTRDLEGAKAELASFSEHALRQTQQLLTLVRTSTALVGHFDVATILREAAEGVALGIGADNALIALLDETAEERTMRVETVYPPMPLPHDAAFPLSAQPAIANAIDQCQQVVWTRPQRGIHTLAMLMGSDVGPGIIQPMVYQERVLGVIVALNGRSHRVFTEDEQHVLEAFTAQVAAAAENAFVYRRLDTQARELAKLLAVREEEADRQAAILESIADGVIVTDNQDQVMLANAAAAAILEIPREELPGQPFGAIFGQVIPIHSGAVTGELSAPGQDTLRAVFQIGARYIQSSLAPVEGPDGHHLGLVAVLRDITAERAAEQAKTEFISTISHELRTPLTSIKGYADLLVAGAAGEVNPVQRNFADMIRTGAERLTGIVNSVIQFSELEQGSLQVRARPIEVGGIIAEVVGSMRSKFEARDLKLTMDIPNDLPNVYADPDRTRQIMEQLLDNAMRFTPPEGQVSVKVAPSWDGTSTERATFIAIAVTDSGVGLTCPNQTRIFERFYRAENPLQVTAGGLGIGLSIALALAQAQGGQLWAESPGATDDQPGHGTTFTFLLPTTQPEAAAVEQEKEAADLTAWLEDALSFLDEQK